MTELPIKEKEARHTMLLLPSTTGHSFSSRHNSPHCRVQPLLSCCFHSSLLFNVGTKNKDWKWIVGKHIKSEALLAINLMKFLVEGFSPSTRNRCRNKTQNWKGRKELSFKRQSWEENRLASAQERVTQRRGEMERWMTERKRCSCRSQGQGKMSSYGSVSTDQRLKWAANQTSAQTDNNACVCD